MGRRSTLREPVERAVVDLLTPGPMLGRDLLAEVQRRTDASEQTVRRWGRRLCTITKRGRPGEPGAESWWSLSPSMMRNGPKIMGIGPKIMRIAAVTPGRPEDHENSGVLGRTPKNTAHRSARGLGQGSTKTTAAATPSLLDDYPRSEGNAPRNQPTRPHGEGERQAVLDAFGSCLVGWGWPLLAVTLTTAPDNRPGDVARRLAARVDAWGGGIWLVPHAAKGSEHQHHHGLTVGVEPRALTGVWVDLARGAAAPEWQDVRAVYSLPGWLGYCRRMPGFDPMGVIVSGPLRDPWIWALGQAGYVLPRPRWDGEARDGVQADAVQRADLMALRRMLARLTPGEASTTPEVGGFDDRDVGPAASGIP